MTVYLPPGWPDQVRPPGAYGWERFATAYLLDQCPADFRGVGVLQRHPLVLARFAAAFVAGQERTARESVAEIRSELADLVAPAVAQAAVEAWLEQSARLARTKRAVALVEAALRGESFVPRL